MHIKKRKFDKTVKPIWIAPQLVTNHHLCPNIRSALWAAEESLFNPLLQIAGYRKAFSLLLQFSFSSAINKETKQP
jgi:hypothetical protein